MNNGQNNKPIIIGSIANDADREQLSNALAGQGKTLDDVEVLSIEEADARGLLDDPQFLAYIQKMGFNSADEMRATYARMARNNAVGNGTPNNNENG